MRSMSCVLVVALGVAVIAAAGGVAGMTGSWPAPGSKEEDLVKHARQAPGKADAGKTFFEKGPLGCISCHSKPGNGGRVGPDLKGAGKRFSREELFQKVLNPRPKSDMPSGMAEHFQNPADFANLIAFLQSLGD